MVDIMTLSGRTLGLLLAPGYDFQQVTRLVQDLRLRDAELLLIGTGETENVAIAGSRGDLIKPDLVLSNISASSMDALIIPGGGSVPRLAADGRVLTLLLEIQSQSKPVAAYGNGPLVLVASGLLADRRVAGIAAIKEELIAAGARYLDKELVVDHKLVTARSVEEITHFVEAVALLLEPAKTLR